MFQKDDYVIYGNSGICRVEDVGVPENYPIVRAGRLYYTLVQVFGSGTRLWIRRSICGIY